MANDSMQFISDSREENWNLNDPRTTPSPQTEDGTVDLGDTYPIPVAEISAASNRSANMQQQNETGGFRPQEPQNVVGNPQNNEEVYLGSFQAVLANNLGYYVVIDFLIGTTELTSRAGILYAVGNNFVTLYEPDTNQYIVCDLYSVKFVTFYRTDPRTQNTQNDMYYTRNRNNRNTRMY
ncbi:MAG: hypothetical protein E7393_03995 [Ruminococcaceae bacterium]|nr:hypothetical protein [Oscillospiraceae bacterium]